MRKPSKTVLAAHKKHKLMSPLSAGKTAVTTKEQSIHVPGTEAKASTSTSTTAKAEPPLISTLTVNASKEETKTAIAALLSLGSDIPPPDEDPTTENAALVPINPNIADTNTGDNAHKPPVLTDPPAAKATAVPVHKRFVTVEYKLKRKYRQPRKFPCAKCGKSYSTQKEVNGHFKETHLPVKCDYCDQFFSCPASMLKHRYSHFETLIECDTCSKGFQFQSQLNEHLHTHQAVGDWVCFRQQCGKRSKRESELDAHLFNHCKTKLKCDQCTYENPDPRNMRALKRKHSDIKSFVCKVCRQSFTWVEQHRHHLKNNKCPGPPT